MTIAGPLSGIADGTFGTVSFWFRFTGGDGAAQHLFNISEAGPAYHLIVGRDGSNLMRMLARDSSLGALVSVASTTSYTADGTWRHCRMSWETGVSFQMYIDAVDRLAGGGTNNAGNIAYNTNVNPTTIGADAVAGQKWTGDVADLWFTNLTNLNWANPTIMQAFRSPSGYPADLGSNGQTPTGSSPILYLGNPFGTFQTNLGTGGNFVVTGALTAASSNPP